MKNGIHSHAIGDRISKIWSLVESILLLTFYSLCEKSGKSLMENLEDTHSLLVRVFNLDSIPDS